MVSVSMSAAGVANDLEGQPNNTRFKVVKIDGQRSTAGKSHPKGAEDGPVPDHILMPNGQKSFTYKRGRWTVTDFYDPPVLNHILSNPSSTCNSSPSTPTITQSLNPLVNRLVTPAAVANATSAPNDQTATAESTAQSAVTTTTTTTSSSAVTAAPVVPVVEESPVNQLLAGGSPSKCLTSHEVVEEVVAESTSHSTECKSDAVDLSEEIAASAESNSTPALSLTPLSSENPADTTSRPDSATPSSPHPVGTDLPSLATVTGLASALGTNEEIGSKVVPIDQSTESGLVTGTTTTGTVIEATSGYATPASINSVTGPNASILPLHVSSVAIDNKIEQAMDLVKSHLMFAVREEVDVLKEKIVGLLERIQALETENAILKQSHMSQDHNNDQHQQQQQLSIQSTTGSHSSSPVNGTTDTTQDLAALVSEVVLTNCPTDDATAVPTGECDAVPGSDSQSSPAAP